MKVMNVNKLSQGRELEIIRVNELKIFNRVLKRFKLLRVRAKISFMAFEACLSVKELFFAAIWKTYVTYLKDGLIKPKM